jgi:hypothetical protein
VAFTGVQWVIGSWCVGERTGFWVYFKIFYLKTFKEEPRPYLPCFAFPPLSWNGKDGAERKNRID